MPNTTTYTPGPWDCDLDYIVAPDQNGRHPDIYIAEIAHSDEEGRVATYQQQHANRQLITAAPDLLESLIDLVGERDIDDSGNCRHCGRDYSGEGLILCPADDCAGNMARSVIAKATTVE